MDNWKCYAQRGIQAQPLDFDLRDCQSIASRWLYSTDRTVLWTILRSQTELFDFPIKQLPERYGIARSAVYVSRERLNVTPHTQGNRSYINASQLNLLDDLHDFLCEDSSGTIDDFLRNLNAVELTPQAVSFTGQLTRQQTGHLPGQ